MKSPKADADYIAAVVALLLPQVHERDKNTEFLLIVLKDLLPLRPDLKVKARC
jgi:HrpA-like RNA helicase